MTGVVVRAFQLVSIGRAEEALRLLATEFESENPAAWHARALALLVLRRHAECAQAATSGLAIDPQHVGLLSSLASARLGLDDFVGAEAAILAALELDPEHADNLTHHAHIAMRMDQLEKAEQLIERALSVEPENEFARKMHAVLAAARDDRGALAERTRELLRILPESPLGHGYLGRIHEREGRPAEALDHYVRAAQLDPTDHAAADVARKARQRAHDGGMRAAIRDRMPVRFRMSGCLFSIIASIVLTIVLNLLLRGCSM